MCRFHDLLKILVVTIKLAKEKNSIFGHFYTDKKINLRILKNLTKTSKLWVVITVNSQLEVIIRRVASVNCMFYDL